jgi:hypothetical protein
MLSATRRIADDSHSYSGKSLTGKALRCAARGPAAQGRIFFLLLTAGLRPKQAKIGLAWGPLKACSHPVETGNFCEIGERFSLDKKANKMVK